MSEMGMRVLRSRKYLKKVNTPSRVTMDSDGR